MTSKLISIDQNTLKTVNTYTVEDLRFVLCNILSTKGLKYYYEKIVIDKIFLIKILYTLEPTNQVFLRVNDIKMRKKEDLKQNLKKGV